MLIASAIKKDNITYWGIRHSDCFYSMSTIGVDRVGAIQGFMTDTGEFLDRDSALLHAIECRQIKNKQDIIGSVLTSEDLW